jgi:hypothetical protein
MFMSLVKHATLLGGIQIPTCWGATFLNSKSLAVKASTGVWDCVLAVATSVVTCSCQIVIQDASWALSGHVVVDDM